MRYRTPMPGDQPVPASPAAQPNLADAVRQLRRGTALVVGDAMLDRYAYGQVERISPEAPIPVLSVERELALPGGAGIVVRCLTTLGAAVELLDMLPPGRLAARKLALRGAAVERVERWRRRGLRVGFLAGDALHLASPAGQPLLEQARVWCDRLVVGVPGSAEDPAAAALAVLPLVDLVTGWSGESAVDSIRALRPDVLLQAGGGAAEGIPGGELRFAAPDQIG